MIFFIIPLVWGLGFTLTHNAVQSIHPGIFAFLRQLIAFLVLLPFCHSLFRQINFTVLKWSFLFALWGTISILCQSFALTTLNSAQTAFYVTLNIIFVPIFSYVLRVGKVSFVDLGAVTLGVISIVVSLGVSFDNFGIGDIFGLCAAVSIALNIVTAQIMLTKCNIDRRLLALVSIGFGVIMLSYFPIHYSASISITSDIILAVLFQGAISTALASYLQLKYQRRIGATKAALILNLDLVFASLFGTLNGEILNINQIIACIIAFTATIFNDIVLKIKKITDTDHN